jgi:hypothetical protein
VGIRCADHVTPSIRRSLNFADKWRSFGRYSSFADYRSGSFFLVLSLQDSISTCTERNGRQASWILSINVITANGEDILDVTFFFNGEVRFHWSLYVKSQNSRVSIATEPHETQDTLQDQEVAVWCGISRNRVIGPIFFNDTIKSGRYCEGIPYPLTEYLSFPGYFQQDGASAHTSRVSMTILWDMLKKS